MASTIALLALAAFFVIMFIFHKIQSWCSSKPVQEATTEPTEPQGELYDPTPFTPTSYCSVDDCTTPTGSYTIDVADDDDNVATVRETRVISFIRFSGYTDSDASSNARSTVLSFWTEFYNSKESECSAPDAVEPLEPTEPEGHLPRLVRYPPLPRFSHSTPDEDGVYTVEIGEMKGFAQRNMLSFKPQKPRALTTKHLKKHSTRTTKHAFLV